MFFPDFFKSLKYECKACTRNISRFLVFGTLFVSIAMIILYAGSSPLWMNNFRILPGGAFSVFVCYLCSIVFFFLCGGIICIMTFYRKSNRKRAGGIILDIISAYVFRVLWIILFFGGFSPLFAMISLVASAVFLIFALINSVKLSSLIPMILCVMTITTCIFFVLTLKFIMFP